MRVRAQYPEAWFLHTDTMWLPHPMLGARDALFRDDTFANLAAAFDAPRRLREYVDHLHQIIYRSVGHIFAISTACRNDLVDRYGIPPSQITVVGTGTGITPANEPPPRDYASGETLFVAKVRFEQKGGPLLLEAFRLAHRVNPRLTLTMVAPNGIKVDDPAVTVLHDLPWTELQRLYRRAALFAMPALYEPWGLVYLEAQQSGTPVLGLSRSALPELTDNGRTAFLCHEASPDAVAKVLLEAHGDPGRLAYFGGQAHAFSADFTWHRTVIRIANSLGLSDRRLR